MRDATLARFGGARSPVCTRSREPLWRVGTRDGYARGMGSPDAYSARAGSLLSSSTVRPPAVPWGKPVAPSALGSKVKPTSSAMLRPRVSVVSSGLRVYATIAVLNPGHLRGYVR